MAKRSIVDGFGYRGILSSFYINNEKALKVKKNMEKTLSAWL
jgi:hypothetical protein